MNDPTTCEHPRFNAAEHELCPDCDEHANDVELTFREAQERACRESLAELQDCYAKALRQLAGFRALLIRVRDRSEVVCLVDPPCGGCLACDVVAALGQKEEGE